MLSNLVEIENVFLQTVTSNDFFSGGAVAFVKPTSRMMRSLQWAKTDFGTERYILNRTKRPDLLIIIHVDVCRRRSRQCLKCVTG